MDVDAVQALREENRTLRRVIDLVSSPLELARMLHGVVELSTEASDCHACFIYLLDDAMLTIRAASPVYAQAVGRVRFSVEEGLTGWVARHRRPEFIRERAMEDPRMKYVPLLEEERFQSMVAVPMLARSGETLGVIVLHTEAPHEFQDETLSLLSQIASLVSGAIENAQRYERERRRVAVLNGLAVLAQELSAVSERAALGALVATGARELLDAEICQLHLLEPGGARLHLLASSPEWTPEPVGRLTAALLLDVLPDRRGPEARALWPELEDSKLLLAPLAAGQERLGVLCAASRPGTRFAPEDEELARALAHLTAIAIKRTELIERLTKANAVKELFEALQAGAVAFAATRAEEVRCPLSASYVLICALPASGRDAGTGEWQASAEALGRKLAELVPRSAVEAGPGPVRAVLSLGPRAPERIEDALRRLSDLGREHGAVVGVSQPCAQVEQAPRALREAQDATTTGRALLPDGGAIAYPELGAYRYLVQITPEDSPNDRMRVAVDVLIAYDGRRQTALLETLERYLSERRSVVESARALYIHPNTLRQRLGRIEELTGLELERDDLLSLELAIKLARLHGRSLRQTQHGRS
jgi:GAF domain-containing protein